MQRRKFLVLIGEPHLVISSAPAFADSSGPQLTSYYDHHMALLNGVAYGWTGRGLPVRMRAGVRQVGVSQDAFFALQNDGRLISWDDAPETTSLLMPEVGAFASGQSGWFGIDHGMALASCQRHGALPRTWPTPASATVPTTTSVAMPRSG